MRSVLLLVRALGPAHPDRYARLLICALFMVQSFRMRSPRILAAIKRCTKHCFLGLGLLVVAAVFRAWSAPVTASSILVISEAVVDGQSRKLSSGSRKPVEISSRTDRVDFWFGPDSRATNPPVRWRYQLEGFDKKWRETDSHMQISFQFIDASSNIVEAARYLLQGESTGWTSRVSTSPFVAHREQVIVPPRAVRMVAVLYSGGSEPVTGILALERLKVSYAGTNARPPSILFDSATTQGNELDQPLGVPDGWVRAGSKPAIAQVFRLASTPHPRHALVLMDDTTGYWGSWDTDPSRSIPVTPGETLVVDWTEAHSVGAGGRCYATYHYLPAGKYTFHVRGVTAQGEWTDVAASLPVLVVPPFWQTLWFRSAMLAFAVAALVSGVRYATWRKVRRRLELLEMQHALERDRARIAKDIHDDLGAQLTRISLLGALAQREMAPANPALELVGKIAATAGEVVHTLDEIVWAVDPENDTLDDLGSYICRFAQEFLAETPVRCRLEVPPLLPPIPLQSEVRHNLFLAVKEALNNLLKHAAATEARLTLTLEGRQLTIVIADNGKGFDPRSAPEGNGLQNMKQRLEDLQGRFIIESGAGQGTRVVLVLPIRTTMLP